MRTKPILGKKLWFGPRAFGWGWAPVSWEGWVVIGLFTIGLFALGFASKEDSDPITPVVLSVAVLLFVGWLKGTSPGGPAARRRLQIQREREEEERRKRA